MSDQVEGIKLVRLAAMQIQHLSPQVCFRRVTLVRTNTLRIVRVE
jgi:hypothetical protein